MVHRERERALSDKNEKENGFRERERERERELYQVNERTRAQVVEEIIKKIKNIDYFNKRDVKIDELMWVFCKSEGVKQKKQIFNVKMDV